MLSNQLQGKWFVKLLRDLAWMQYGERRKESEQMTIVDLKRHLSVFKDHDELVFGNGDLTFYRANTRGRDQVQIEFSETYEVEATEEVRIAPSDLSRLLDPKER
jgi:hypothetical protein